MGSVAGGLTFSLGRRLIFYMILSSAVLSAAAAAVQLYLGFERDRAQILTVVDKVEQSFSQGLSSALWTFNFQQVDVLLDGIATQTEIDAIALAASTGQQWHRGDLAAAGLIHRVLELSHPDGRGGVAVVGSLDLGVTLAAARDRVWNQLWTLLISNFAKTVVASMIILAIFNAMITRHLRAIAQFVGGSSWLDTPGQLALDRQAIQGGDELSDIAGAINHAKRSSREDYETIRSEVRVRRKIEADLVDKAAALEAANSLLKQTNREQAEFAYAMSHDLKAPTNSARMLIEEYRKAATHQDDPDDAKLLELASATLARMTDMVDSVLDYSQTIEDAEFERKPVDLNLLVDGVLDDLRADIAQSGALIQKVDLPKVAGDPAQLRMLFQNLISNAVKFRDQARIPEVRIEAEQLSSGREVRIDVADNGIGIDPKFHDKIFGLFQRLHIHEEYPGSGLGLTLVKRIVANHRGRLNVISSPGVGTRFQVTLASASS